MPLRVQPNADSRTPNGPFTVLDTVRIASPCSADWAAMAGDDRSRFCAHCEKHVYNLSAMSRAEAEALIREKEGKFCARFYQRRDGTVLTDNCPVGLRRARRALAAMIGQAGAVAATFIAILGVGKAAKSAADSMHLADVEPIRTIAQKLHPKPPSPPVMMGAIALPPSPTKPAGNLPKSPSGKQSNHRPNGKPAPKSPRA